jgi:peptidoglycan/LPS O-acetylase OafA/YrhL
MHLEAGEVYQYLTLFLFALTVYVFALEHEGFVSKILMLKPFQYLGKISYSVYMTHAIVVTGTYNLLMFLTGAKAGSVAGVPTGIVLPYAGILNIFFVLIVVLISTWTYRAIELPGQAYIKRKFLK